MVELSEELLDVIYLINKEHEQQKVKHDLNKTRLNNLLYLFNGWFLEARRYEPFPEYFVNYEYSPMPRGLYQAMKSYENFSDFLSFVFMDREKTDSDIDYSLKVLANRVVDRYKPHRGVLLSQLASHNGLENIIYGEWNGMRDWKIQLTHERFIYRFLNHQSEYEKFIILFSLLNIDKRENEYYFSSLRDFYAQILRKERIVLKDFLWGLPNCSLKLAAKHIKENYPELLI